MLVCYPIEAAQENWLHEGLASMITSLHVQLDAREEISETQESWTYFVSEALDEPYREKIIRSRGIRDHFFSYKRVIESLLPLQRQAILATMEAQNQVALLLSGGARLQTLVDFPNVQSAVYKLFVFCYEKLTELKVRERQYQLIYNSLPDKMCPFCGIDRLMHFDDTAQDQDHYLAKSIYPFAAANMKNLVPMCRYCNRDCKKAVDVIRDEQGRRRLAFNPYNCIPPRITLLNSAINDHGSPPRPEWNVEFQPQSEEAETWDSVFKIRKRYKRDVLGNCFDSWLQGFSNKCKSDRGRGLIRNNFTNDDVRKYLLHYYEDKLDSPSIGMAGFLEPLAFEFLLSQFDVGNERIIWLIRDVVLGISFEEVA